MKRWLLGCVLLALCRNSLAHAQAVPESAATAQPMAPDAHPGFDVATIKPSDLEAPDTSDGEMGHRVVMSRTTVRFLIAFAYDLHEKQILDGPDWIASEKFDFAGVSDTPGDPSLQQLKGMFQKLLADRFALTFRREPREMPAYVVTVARDGSKLERSKDDSHGAPSLLMQPGFPKVAALKGRNLSMTEFAQLMQSGILDRPVVDKTGLVGRYDFLLRWTPDESQFNQTGARLPSPDITADAPSLFTAMQEQLGLKVTADKKAPVQAFVITRVEPPSAN